MSKYRPAPDNMRAVDYEIERFHGGIKNVDRSIMPKKNKPQRKPRKKHQPLEAFDFANPPKPQTPLSTVNKIVSSKKRPPIPKG